MFRYVLILVKVTVHAPVVRKMNNAIHQINLYPKNNSIGFPNTYPLDSDLSGGLRYPAFEQPGAEQQHQQHHR